jgi:hypothetical protein
MVTDCGELVAAGAVKVADVVVVFDRVPALALQVTPAALRSLVTVAVSVTVSVPSTVVADAVTATLGEGELPPQPVNKYNEYARIPTQSSAHFLCSISHPRDFMKPHDEEPGKEGIQSPSGDKYTALIRNSGAQTTRNSGEAFSKSVLGCAAIITPLLSFPNFFA